ncbi:MAG: hypothetical protein CMK53_02610 [Proteobacteria bacterium]|nr:hypothetical protein [Pseudomonadota bacterium]HCP33012.1 hypothetical protein [Deltaproteobacteria bacterium]
MFFFLKVQGIYYTKASSYFLHNLLLSCKNWIFQKSLIKLSRNEDLHSIEPVFDGFRLLDVISYGKPMMEKISECLHK